MYAYSIPALNASCIYFGIGLGTVLGGLALEHGVAALYVLASILALAAIVFLRLTGRTPVHDPGFAR